MSALSLHDAVRAKLRAMTGGGGQSASREPSSQVESVAESVPSQFDRMKSKIKSASRFRVGVRHIEKSPHMQLPSSDKRQARRILTLECKTRTPITHISQRVRALCFFACAAPEILRRLVPRPKKSSPRKMRN